MAAIAGHILLIVNEFLYKIHKINHLKNSFGFLRIAWWILVCKTNQRVLKFPVQNAVMTNKVVEGHRCIISNTGA